MAPGRLKMHRKAFGGRAPPWPVGELKRSPRPPSRNGGPTSKGRGEERGRNKKEGGEGKGRALKLLLNQGPSESLLRHWIFCNKNNNNSLQFIMNASLVRLLIAGPHNVYVKCNAKNEDNKLKLISNWGWNVSPTKNVTVPFSSNTSYIPRAMPKAHLLKIFIHQIKYSQ